MSESNSLGSTIVSAIITIACIVYFFSPSCSCEGGKQESASPIGTYQADVTLAQSGCMTTIVLNSDGSAVMQQDGSKPRYTYWDYAGNRNDVRISDGRDGWWFIDFDKNRIYYGAQDYRSKQRGYRLSKK